MFSLFNSAKNQLSNAVKKLKGNFKADNQQKEGKCREK